MLKASPPARFNIPFASGAGGGFIRSIPQASQIGIQGGAASLTDGFPPLNFQPVAAGGIPPFGEDFNGLMFQTTGWCQWFEAGAPIYFDATFAAGGSGGYPQGALVQSAVVPGNFWLNTVDGNTTNPDSISSANWVPDPSRIASGTPIPSFSSTVPTGFVTANTLTIGNAASNATQRANADTLLAYRSIWTNFSNSACPIFTSAGSPTTRGANPDADFAANKALAAPDMRGRNLMGVDTMAGPATTRLSGVPVSSGSVTSPTSIFGENTHVLTVAELAVHVHSNTLTDLTHTHPYSTSSVLTGTGTGATIAMSSPGSFNTSANNSTPMSITNANQGSSNSHNNVAQSCGVYWNIKL